MLAAEITIRHRETTRLQIRVEILTENEKKQKQIEPNFNIPLTSAFVYLDYDSNANQPTKPPTAKKDLKKKTKEISGRILMNRFNRKLV